ncbi:hypothetical protein NE236_35300 [Actinoallomurus purpureus]|uniref:hypothetical protein n=1 Tax=Actinoallomurus purpureus TaxID=478114 RepID=UPI00209344BE|nr:hypothetical protein [Actinoallomurus purpureus]MCO6010244.1 hypothetical protein [Actinoallomurus purpureus]
MKHTTRRLAVTLAASTLAVGGMTTLTAMPALAYTEKCTGYQHKEFDTWGNKTDVKLKLCVSKSGGYHYATAYGNFWDGNGWTDKFDKFKLQVRLERSNKTKGTKTCDYKNLINNHESSAISCGSASSKSGAKGGWTADATVTYDINGDKLGSFKWELGGTQSIS